MRLIFMGTPAFAVPALDALVAAGHEIACVYSQPPRPGGRGQRPRPSPVRCGPRRWGCAVRSPARLRDPGEQAAFAALGAEVAVVAAYGLILPPAVLTAPARGCLNIHASLLPRWRGAAPIQRAIMAGDAETGISIMAMEAGLDTGPVLMREAVAIGPARHRGELARRGWPGSGARHDRRGAGAGSTVLVAVPQPEAGVSYAAKIDKAEARVDWARPAVEVDRLIRGLAPFPGAWAEIGGERVKLLAERGGRGGGARRARCSTRR